MNTVEFYKIKKEDIFSKDFEKFDKNNKLRFSNDGMAVIYAPNGVGKTSFTRVLNCEKGCTFEAKFETIIANENTNELFCVISDQNSRHIIKGETEEFLLGNNIKREFELKGEIDKAVKDIFENRLPKILKETFNISKTKSLLIDLIEDVELKEYISDIANIKSKGKGIDVEKFTKKIKALEECQILEYEDDKFEYYVKDIDSKDSIINRINQIAVNNIRTNEKVEEIEENSVAIEILSKYNNKKCCIVCDNPDIPEDLLNSKKENKSKIIEKLNETEKYIVNEIIEKLQQIDPFNIKIKLIDTMKKGNKEILFELKEKFQKYNTVLNQRINNLLVCK